MTSTAKSKPQLRSALTPDRRRTLLDEYFSCEQSLDDVTEKMASASGLEAHKLQQHADAYAQRCSTLWDEYRDGVPVVPLSRCPFTNKVASHSIDFFDLDGLWWNYETAVRPVENLPETYFALAGAVKLNGGPTWSPFLCKPGPEAPYVIPRLFEKKSVKAVLSSIPIGAHEGYAIFYFAKPMIYRVPRVNTWGCNEYILVDKDGTRGWDVVAEDAGEFDYELDGWIESGRLLWIAPGDQTLTLEKTTKDCPYLGLEGRRDILRIQSGRVWTMEQTR